MEHGSKAASTSAAASPNTGAQQMNIPAQEPKAAKKSKNQKVSKAAKKTAGQSAAAKSKSNAEKTAQPGIIATICTTLEKAKAAKKPVTVNDILDHLEKTFPGRDRAGMAITVRAQLSRLPREKDFDIKKVRDGRTVTYQAA